MGSDIRKAKGTTLAPVAEFYKTRGENFVQDFSNTAAKEIANQVYTLGSVFFATDENAIVRSATIKWAAYLQTGSISGGVLATAMVRHLASLQTKTLAREQVPDTLEEFQDFLTALERNAIERGCSAISVKISVRSPWIDLFSRIEEYHIVSNDLPSQGEVRVTFEKKLLLGFRGDAADWPSLVSWYLDFCFGSVSPDLQSSLERFRKDTRKPLDFLLRGYSARGLPERVILPGDLPMRLICIPEYAGPLDATVRLDSEERSRFTILATESGAFPIVSIDKAVSKSNLTTLLREVRESIANASALKNDLSTQAQTALDTWHELQQMPDRSERQGLVVEIDRNSFVNLMKRLKSGSIKEYFYFFNDGHFARMVGSGLKVFFFVWDAPIGKLRGEDDTRPRGCICASGELLSARHLHQDDIYSDLADRGREWRDPPDGFGAFSNHAIWEEADFIPKFFSGDVVLLRMVSLSASCPSDFDHAEAGYCGLDHEKFLEAVIPRSESWTTKQEDQIKRLLPEWDMGNSYLDRNQTRKLSLALANSLQDCSVYDWPEKRSTSCPSVVYPQSSGDEERSADYWVNKLRTEPNWPVEFAKSNPGHNLTAHDVFLSFATNDAKRRGLVISIEKELNRRLKTHKKGPVWSYLNPGHGAPHGERWAPQNVWHMATCRCCVIVASREYEQNEITMKLELPFLIARKLRDGEKFKVFVARGTDNDINGIEIPTFRGEPEYFELKPLADERQFCQGKDGDFSDFTLEALLDENKSAIFHRRIATIADAIAKWLADQ